MRESDSREVALSGAEADLLDDAVEHHDLESSDVERDVIDDLESTFDTDLAETADGTFELTRGSARVVLSAIEAYEPLVEGETATRLDELRGRFADAFGFADRGSSEVEPEDEERYPGST